ncbi:LytTR family DNA-binding domain-containing protein [Flavobacterium chungnamense]|uniref:LytTR family DNA-binding domain-containing protein n=1 Tax=Flavobacterium chungnamense TaxID=706182 RepID=A0ABP7ULL7_9FLAO
MKCIIIDDEKMSREILSIMILKSMHLFLEADFSNAIDAIKYLNDENNTIDVIFLDIHMPNFSGFDFIKTIKNPPHIILVTTDQNFALEAFNYECIIDYLVKPIQENRFNRAIERVEQKFENSKKSVSNIDSEIKEIYLNIDKRLVKVEVSTINFIKANGDYVFIKTDSQNYTVHTTLKKIEDKLSNSFFLKVHRSYIINLNKIIDIQDSTVLVGSKLIPVSKNNRSNLMFRLTLV